MYWYTTCIRRLSLLIYIYLYYTFSITEKRLPAFHLIKPLHYFLRARWKHLVRVKLGCIPLYLLPIYTIHTHCYIVHVIMLISNKYLIYKLREKIIAYIFEYVATWSYIFILSIYKYRSEGAAKQRWVVRVDMAIRTDVGYKRKLLIEHFVTNYVSVYICAVRVWRLSRKTIARCDFRTIIMYIIIRESVLIYIDTKFKTIALSRRQGYVLYYHPRLLYIDISVKSCWCLLHIRSKARLAAVSDRGGNTHSMYREKYGYTQTFSHFA